MATTTSANATGTQQCIVFHMCGHRTRECLHYTQVVASLAETTDVLAKEASASDARFLRSCYNIDDRIPIFNRTVKCPRCVASGDDAAASSSSSSTESQDDVEPPQSATTSAEETAPAEAASSDASRSSTHEQQAQSAQGHTDDTEQAGLGVELARQDLRHIMQQQSQGTNNGTHLASEPSLASGTPILSSGNAYEHRREQLPALNTAYNPDTAASSHRHQPVSQHRSVLSTIFHRRRNQGEEGSSVTNRPLSVYTSGRIDITHVTLPLPNGHLMAPLHQDLAPILRQAQDYLAAHAAMAQAPSTPSADLLRTRLAPWLDNMRDALTVAIRSYADLNRAIGAANVYGGVGDLPWYGDAGWAVAIERLEGRVAEAGATVEMVGRIVGGTGRA